MEWFTAIRSAIDYMEQNLDTVAGTEEVADSVYMSAMYLQRGFQIVTGYGIGEYLRNRRFYQAALKLADSDHKVIDVALESGIIQYQKWNLRKKADGDDDLCQSLFMVAVALESRLVLDTFRKSYIIKVI